MASKRVNCSWCGMQSLLPLEAQTLHCQGCHRYTTFQSYGKSHQPVNAGGIFRPQVQPQPYAPPSHRRRRAVLCGIIYKGQKHSLNGSINDVLYMKKFLVERCGFPISSILLLTEEEAYPRVPTKKNIRAALQWLVHGCQPGDSLVFHYSGHGSQVRDRDGDELDGYDESLVPVDYETEGKILDDEINATIVRPLPRGATLHAVIDTCFSGTFLDLPNICRINREGYYKWENHSTHAAYKGTNGGFAISISACDDNQNSGDTTAFTGAAIGALTYSFVQTLEQEPELTYGSLLDALHKRIGATREKLGLNSDVPHLSQALSGDTSTGAMTYSFIQAAQNEPGLTYGRLLSAMRHTIRDSKTGFLQTAPVASFFKKVLNPKLPQEPQLSSSEKFEIYSRPFLL